MEGCSVVSLSGIVVGGFSKDQRCSYLSDLPQFLMLVFLLLLALLGILMA